MLNDPHQRSHVTILSCTMRWRVTKAVGRVDIKAHVHTPLERLETPAQSRRMDQRLAFCIDTIEFGACAAQKPLEHLALIFMSCIMEHCVAALVCLVNAIRL